MGSDCRADATPPPHAPTCNAWHVAALLNITTILHLNDLMWAASTIVSLPVLRALISPTFNSHISIQPTSLRVGNWEYRRSNSPFHHTGAVWMRNSGGCTMTLNLHNVTCHLQWTLMLIYFWEINVLERVCMCVDEILRCYIQFNTGQTSWLTLGLLHPSSDLVRGVSFFVSEFVPVSSHLFSWLIFIWSSGSLLTRRSGRGVGLADTNDSKQETRTVGGGYTVNHIIRWHRIGQGRMVPRLPSARRKHSVTVWIMQ